MGENFQSFQFLGNSLTHDPRNPKTILATGSIIQDKADHDAALLKYRIGAVHTPDSSELWNNIGMCFFGKQKYVAAIACLKRALYLDPFQWIVAFNLGLVNLNTKQYASAYHYFSVAINLKPDFSNTYMYLGITLNRLGDFESSCQAFERAIELEKNDCMIYLNFAIVLYNNGKKSDANV
jgi:Bardet-Biedl syndrome 4 protein